MGTTGPPLLARLALDALEEFERAADEVPPPGRGGPIGRLSQPGWVIGHVASTVDAWVNGWCAGGEHDAWSSDWFQRHVVEGAPATAPYLETREAFERIATKARTYLEQLEAPMLARRLTGPPEDRSSHTVEVLLARTVAHLFAHAGELSVTCSLLRRPDLGLPDRMGWSLHGPLEAGPLLVRVLLDAREAFARVADAAPVPAQAGAFMRLNAGGWIVAHIAEEDDQYWSVQARGLEADAWLAEAHVRFGDEASKPIYTEARAALERSFGRSRPYLEGLRASDFGRVVRRSRLPERGEQTVQDLIVLQLTHVYALAGELAAISSLAGGEDPGLPGTMSHTLEAAS